MEEFERVIYQITVRLDNGETLSIQISWAPEGEILKILCVNLHHNESYRLNIVFNDIDDIFLKNPVFLSLPLDNLVLVKEIAKLISTEKLPVSTVLDIVRLAKIEGVRGACKITGSGVSDQMGSLNSLTNTGTIYLSIYLSIY
jgi:hypothetical protein